MDNNERRNFYSAAAAAAVVAVAVAGLAFRLLKASALGDNDKVLSRRG